MTTRFRTTMLAGALASAVALLGVQPLGAQAVVQAVPPPSLGDLQSALSVLARDPRDLAALLKAAWASLELDDATAAEGYFTRAQAVSPANGEAKAGFATLALKQGDAVRAVTLFAEAEATGVPMARFAGDRGLAHDLVGDNIVAQTYYRQAMTQGDDPELIRRLALSQAIVGDQGASEATLLPLLQRSDLAAYRARAFALAILGKSEEAVSIAQTMLPGSLSNRMAPYLRYMPRLTRAQQAAAANLGRFPPADQIGRDAPDIAARTAAAGPVQVAANTPDARLAPAGQPLGSASRPAPQAANNGTARRQQPATASRPAEKIVPASEALVRTPAATPTPAAALPAAELPVVATDSGAGTPPGLIEPVAVAPSEIAPAPIPVQVAGPLAQQTDVPRPSLSISPPATAETVSPAPEQAGLADVFADFAQPVAVPAASAPGAVDLRTINIRREAPPQREEAKAPEKPKPPANPSRVWVQIATGRDTSALAFDWRRIQKAGGALLAKRSPFTAKWGQTNRLVVGPYASAAEAQKAVSDLKKAGVDSFTFTSDEGEAVNPLK